MSCSRIGEAPSPACTNNLRCIKGVADRLDETIAIAFECSSSRVRQISEAATRSSFRDEITRASTAALIVEMTIFCLIAA